ncbi:methyltransferase domain-containing protein [Methylobacterium radiotolerans]|jgi:predicted TPR repeat methyltransferase|uniref:Methyltransferase type 11 n=1 Tax=Methylobacterium radiotolerans (strain ATCC 27329 / DSM 1819 / JCM 2831 / NBRC 15690 / NCIMB 10815 / 0-1) TaxID=426355 RepID=B1LW19_METRJ|nr:MULTISPECIES: methyltransferase domain-containing protein [Methylobacterium]ACB25669.1 Methyltransferase type 11 [Methylobacterium radiotolerans JCM 2831]MDE3744693.1 methyltransferase domain-containing protein [Methylobacterium radiotolerans]ONF46826.1 methyltransferase type 12 [Methylobacterium radiotolerans]PVZ04034.1 putative TPR repeat methyltransferase [Methylobacterium organophilum]GEM97166.1 methyltransferase [Methylobacterium radiotolerans]
MASQLSSGDLLADRRYRYAEACLADGDHAGAADLAEQALERAPRYLPAWLLLGRARAGLAASGTDPALRDAAAQAYARALDIDPEDRLGVRAHLVRLGGGDTLPVLSPAYVRALFDDYAPRFERHLVEGLGYVGPQLVRDALPRAPERFAVALDLGCGTGLMGEVVRDRVDHLTGIDLSPGMLALARTKTARGRPLYERLVEGDVAAALADLPEASADLCLAADVLIYVADLASFLAGVGRVLRPGGLGAFTVQSHDGPGSVLGEDGRYAHADAHLAATAAVSGLERLAARPAEVRREGGRPVPGRVVVLRRTSA